MTHPGHAISIRSPTVCKVVICTVARVHATTTARKARRRRSCHPQRDPGPPLGQPQPTRSRLGAMRRTERRRSRAGQIALARGAQTALARRPASGTAGRRERLARPTHTAHAARSGSALASCCCAHAAAAAARPAPRAGPTAASTAGSMGTRQGHCDDSATCQSAATGPTESLASQA